LHELNPKDNAGIKQAAGTLVKTDPADSRSSRTSNFYDKDGKKIDPRRSARQAKKHEESAANDGEKSAGGDNDVDDTAPDKTDQSTGADADMPDFALDQPAAAEDIDAAVSDRDHADNSDIPDDFDLDGDILMHFEPGATRSSHRSAPISTASALALTFSAPNSACSGNPIEPDPGSSVAPEKWFRWKQRQEADKIAHRSARGGSVNMCVKAVCRQRNNSRCSCYV